MFQFVKVNIFFGFRLRAKTSRGAAFEPTLAPPCVENERLFFLGGAGGDHIKFTPLDFGFKICFNFVSSSSFKAKGSRLS